MKIYFALILLFVIIVQGFQRNSGRHFPCPPGVRPVQCFVDPCFNKFCPANPSAICVANYCGGCNAIWIGFNGRRVQCDRRSTCPPGQQLFLCFRDPCQDEVCPREPWARCFSNYCGTCSFTWKRPDGSRARCF